MMKKLLYLIPLLFVSRCWSDTLTSGSVALLLPTTGIVDLNRSWADKYNTNFQILVSTFDTLSNTVTALNSSTSTLTTSVNNLTTTSNGHTNDIAALNSATATFTTRFNNVATDTTTLRNRFENVAIDTTSIKTAINNGLSSIYDEGSNQGSVTTFNFTGANVAASVSGATATINVTGGSGGGGVSTFTFTLQDGGDIFLGTSAFATYNTAWRPVGRSTLNVVGLQAFTTEVSSTAKSAFKLVRTTAPAGALPYDSLSPEIHVSTNQRYSVFVTTSFKLYPGEMFSVQVTSIPTSGKMPSKFGIMGEFWRQ